MGTPSISIQMDDATYKIAERLARISNQSVSEMIKEMIINLKPIIKNLWTRE